MILDPLSKPIVSTHTNEEIVQFWDSLESILKLSNEKTGNILDESKVNSKLVTFLKIATDSYKIYINSDQDLYRLALILTESSIFNLKKKFCLSKLLSLLNIDLLEMNMKFIISYILLCESKKNLNSLETMIEFQGFNVFYNTLYTQFAYLNKYGEDDNGNILTKSNNNELNELDVTIIDEMKQISTVLMDLLFQIFKFCKCSITSLQIVDDFFVYFLLTSIRSDTTDDLFNNAQFKLILVLNEQYMMFARDFEIGNKIFEYLIGQRKITSKFSELLLLKFNRTEDHTIQIMICKILYLILNRVEDGTAMNFFYLNDLNVLVDVLIRQLEDISENEEILRSTFLRVLLPLLKNTELSKTHYRKDDIVNLLRYLSNIDNICSNDQVLHEHRNTVKLAFKCLTQVNWLTFASSEYDPDFPDTPTSRTSSISVVGMGLTMTDGTMTPVYGSAAAVTNNTGMKNNNNYNNNNTRITTNDNGVDRLFVRSNSDNSAESLEKGKINLYHHLLRQNRGKFLSLRKLICRVTLWVSDLFDMNNVQTN
ncbi:Ldb17p NDAI_0A02080 [Naumovozyma dairenensis CBS 421]|uniref:SPIN90/Ldb17 leucine-rich domain-containing protein n=1 Tax=Naumovozyma dairenensis (strain ATCC 10597 / BCRC 20456 / CBS 421 / NBRC 0211 / NRRL Y-12639) TaxID=1071378 RepID=G0W3H8_NAUDC|nr:hypothetical protein NDAI_0A02080 [Naumovozyma dairenensis CBS 421]CCD22366.1 hypothetical protein NDAI_0A02080 [Naumovozyma dairenensis CBS 421]